ncbi:MAG: endonuclease III domain-containing protein [Candidatus Micrarchaeia archaeon]
MALHPFLAKIGFYLRNMDAIATKMNAPVISAENNTKSPFEILVYTMLSSRTRDENTIMATKKFFKIAKTPKDVCKLSINKITAMIRPVGFYRTKAKTLKKMCNMINEKYNGKIPSDVKELMRLPGVGLKTANIVMARAFNKDVIGVDTHVHRISNRLGIVSTKTPEKTSEILNEIVPKRYRRKFNRIFVGFGQVICLPVRPRCDLCPINKACYRIGVQEK